MEEKLTHRFWDTFSGSCDLAVLEGINGRGYEEGRRCLGQIEAFFSGLSVTDEETRHGIRWTITSCTLTLAQIKGRDVLECEEIFARLSQLGFPDIVTRAERTGSHARYLLRNGHKEQALHYLEPLVQDLNAALSAGHQESFHNAREAMLSMAAECRR